MTRRAPLLAGVTVTATSPSALGVQTTISSETGNYRFPSIPSILDLFNITNSHKSELLTRTTGANYLRPGNIMAPFTTRIGMRFVF